MKCEMHSARFCGLSLLPTLPPLKDLGEPAAVDDARKEEGDPPADLPLHRWANDQSGRTFDTASST